MGAWGACLAALVLIASAGCLASDPPPKAKVTPPPLSAEGNQSVTPEAKTIPLKLQGSFPNAVHACHDAIGCRGAETGAHRTELRVEKLAGNLTSLVLTMTWSASEPTMQTLGVAAMVMYPKGSCDACKSVEFVHAKGASPLKLDYHGDPQPIQPPGVLHVYFYAYNAANDPVALGADTETAVNLEGSAMLVPS